MPKKDWEWPKLVQVIKKDAEEKDCVVTFISQTDSLDHSCYVYHSDDLGQTLYVLNDQHRAQLIDSIEGFDEDEVADSFWSILNEYHIIGRNDLN
jgi:predicted DNA binding protein